MSRRLLVSFFDHEDDILGASRTVRESGFHIAGVYTPYAVHGLDKAMGLPPSKLPFRVLDNGSGLAHQRRWKTVEFAAGFRAGDV